LLNRYRDPKILRGDGDEKEAGEETGKTSKKKRE
jgi:hypothetical protein